MVDAQKEDEDEYLKMDSQQKVYEADYLMINKKHLKRSKAEMLKAVQNDPDIDIEKIKKQFKTLGESQKFV